MAEPIKASELGQRGRQLLEKVKKVAAAQIETSNKIYRIDRELSQNEDLLEQKAQLNILTQEGNFLTIVGSVWLAAGLLLCTILKIMDSFKGMMLVVPFLLLVFGLKAKIPAMRRAKPIKNRLKGVTFDGMEERNQQLREEKDKITVEHQRLADEGKKLLSLYIKKDKRAMTERKDPKAAAEFEKEFCDLLVLIQGMEEEVGNYDFGFNFADANWLTTDVKCMALNSVLSVAAVDGFDWSKEAMDESLTWIQKLLFATIMYAQEWAMVYLGNVPTRMQTQMGIEAWETVNAQMPEEYKHLNLCDKAKAVGDIIATPAANSIKKEYAIMLKEYRRV